MHLIKVLKECSPFVFWFCLIFPIFLNNIQNKDLNDEKIITFYQIINPLRVSILENIYPIKNYTEVGSAFVFYSGIR